jgi:hypothetical protein
MSNNNNVLVGQTETKFEESDYNMEIKLEEYETTLTKEEKARCFEVVNEVSKYLKSDREKLFLIERLALELENNNLSITFGKTVRAVRAELNKAETLQGKPAKKGLVIK